jgi:hypothetical protein
MIKLFLLLYMLALVLVTIFGVIWILAAIFTPQWATKKSTLVKYIKQ